MFSLTFLTRRLPHLTLDQFVEHYRGIHFELGSQLPGLISYQQSVLLKTHDGWPMPHFLAEWDALSIYTFESREAAERAFASDIGQTLNEDTGQFMQWESVLSLPAIVIQRWEAGHGAIRLSEEQR